MNYSQRGGEPALPASLPSSARYFLIICVLVLAWPLLARAQETAPAPGAIQRTAHFAEILQGDAPRDVADLRSMEQQIQQVTAEATKATVGVAVGSAQGSGVIVTEDGLVLTAGHVIGAPGRDVTLILADGRRVKGVTLGTDRSVDSGAIQITTKGTYPYLNVRRAASLQEGEWVLVMGHAGGIVKDREPALRLGRVLARSDEVIATDATLVGGDSGGPLLDLEGHVIGVNSRIGNRITANLHVPSEMYLGENLKRLRDGDVWGRIGGTQPFLGVRCDADEDALVVTQITPNSPAEAAGLVAGDTIVGFNGKKLETFDQLRSFINQYSPGDKIKLQIRRAAGKTETVEVELKDRRTID